MKASVALRISCADESAARSLESVLSPDNAAVPRDQRFSMARRSSGLLFSIESDRVQSAVATAEGILSDAALFQEIWLISRRRRA